MMKIFNAIARAVAVILFLVMLYAAWWKAGYLGCAMVIGGAAAVFMLWNACPPKAEESAAKLQIVIMDDDTCCTKFNTSALELGLAVPTAIASLCKAAEQATRGAITPDYAIEQAKKILSGESKFVKILKTEEV